MQKLIVRSAIVLLIFLGLTASLMIGPFQIMVLLFGLPLNDITYLHVGIWFLTILPLLVWATPKLSRALLCRQPTVPTLNHVAEKPVGFRKAKSAFVASLERLWLHWVGLDSMPMS